MDTQFSAKIPANFNDEAMLETLNAYMVSYEAGLIEDYFINLAEDFANDAVAQGFDAAAKKYGVESTEIGPFPINYGNSPMFSYLPTEAALASASTSDSFFETAFGLSQNEISRPVVLGSNIVVLKYLGEENGEPVDDFTYMYYSSLMNNYEVQHATVYSDKVENNVLEAYFNQLVSNMSTDE